MSYVPSNRRMTINFQQTPPKNIYDIWLSFNQHQDENGQYVRDSSLQSNYDFVFKVFFDGDWRPVSGISINNQFIEQALKKKMNIVNSYTAGHIPVFVTGEDECDQLEDGGDIATLIQNYINGGGTIPISRATTSNLGGIKADVHNHENITDQYVEVKFKYYATDLNNDDRLYVSVSELVEQLNNYLIGGGTFNLPLAGPNRRGGVKAPYIDNNEWNVQKFIPVQLKEDNEKLYLDGEDIVEVLTYILQNTQTEFYEAGLGIDITDNVISIDTTGAVKGSFLQYQLDQNDVPYLTWAFPSGGNTYTAGTGLTLSEYQFSLKPVSSTEIGGVKANSLSPSEDVAKAYCYIDNENPNFLVVKLADILGGAMNGAGALLQAGMGITITHTLTTDPWTIKVWGTEDPANFGKYFYLDKFGQVQWVNGLGYPTLAYNDHDDETSYVIAGIGDEVENPEDYFLNGNGEWAQPDIEAEIDFATTEECGGIYADTHNPNDANAFKPVECKFYPTNGWAALQHRLCINARDVITQINEYNYYNQSSPSITGGLGITVLYQHTNVGGIDYYNTGISLSHSNNDWGKFLKIAANGQSIEWIPLDPLTAIDHASDKNYLVTGIGNSQAGKENQFYLNALGQWAAIDYQYILNTPTIPTLVQSDWNQTDTAADDYIKNKPALPEQIQCVSLTDGHLKFVVQDSPLASGSTEYKIEKNTYFIPSSLSEILIGGDDDIQLYIDWDSGEDAPLNGEAKIFFHTSASGNPILNFSKDFMFIADYSMTTEGSPAVSTGYARWQLNNSCYYIITITRDTIQVQKATQVPNAVNDAS